MKRDSLSLVQEIPVVDVIRGEAEKTNFPAEFGRELVLTNILIKGEVRKIELDGT